MPFQSNPNAGQVDPGLLQLLFQRQSDRAKLQIEQQKSQMLAMQQAKEDERANQKFLLEMAQGAEALNQARLKTAGDLQTLMGGIGERAEAVPAEQRQAAQSQQFFGSVGDGDQQLGQGFAAAVLPYDPNAFNDELALASTLTGDTVLDRDVDTAAQLGGFSRSDVLGGAQTRLGVRDVAEQRELDKTLAGEQRQVEREIEQAKRDEQRTIRQENRSVENAVTQSRRIAEQTQMAQLESGDRLINHRFRLRQQIAETEAGGGDATLLNEKLALVNGRIAALRDPTSVRQTAGMPAKTKIDIIRQGRGATAGINRVADLSQAMDDGRIKTGAGGAIENFRLRAVGTMQSLLNLDPNFDPQVRGALESAISQGQDFVRVQTDEGEQLTLGIDQILLTYEMIRNGRGQNARITVGEISKVAKEFNFTGLFTTEGQIKGALKKTARALAQERATAFSLFEAFGEDTSLLQGEEIFPEDQSVIDSISGSALAPSAPSAPSAPLDESGAGLEPGILDSIRQRRGASSGIR